MESIENESFSFRRGVITRLAGSLMLSSKRLWISEFCTTAKSAPSFRGNQSQIVESLQRPILQVFRPFCAMLHRCRILSLNTLDQIWQAIAILCVADRERQAVRPQFSSGDERGIGEGPWGHDETRLRAGGVKS